MSDYLTVAQMAEKVGMSVRWVRDQIARGELKATRMGVKLWRIPRAEAEAFEQRMAQQPKGA